MTRAASAATQSTPLARGTGPRLGAAVPLAGRTSDIKVRLVLPVPGRADGLLALPVLIEDRLQVRVQHRLALELGAHAVLDRSPASRLGVLAPLELLAFDFPFG